MDIKRKFLIKEAKDYVIMVFALFLCAFGFAAFIIPEGVVTGGVAGISTIIYFASGKAVNIAVPNYAINVLLLVIAYRTVGRQFVLRTIFGATIFSMFLGFLTPMFPHPIVNQQSFMNVIIGAILCGTGLGTTFAHNGSSGGTDVIAAMVNKHSNVSFGRMMLYCDLCIITSSYLLFHQLDKIVFGYVFLVINSFVSDFVINNRFQGRQFLIVSEKWQDIANAINNEANRGCTLLHGTGWYTKQDVKILMVVCRKYESITVQRIIKAIDPNAFISIASTSGVFGKGFDKMKIRLHKYKPKLSDETTTVQKMDNAQQNDNHGVGEEQK
ncbi:MAG: YitT family protein [Sodaliphilus pleomorphus]|jgi:uncharacterized membrane-anchored protein YitT (DUF2179 family)|uniref:YitT family protein n=1 Tax=Sodaliphilus pleomorphus TaxID=2606626 RepID=A0A6L5X9I6_9BACT|nr:YitT family protein [Sodaliphilus pleomorphus]MCI6169271.1 YitT family protein [Muribaculaceae bacterium]MDY6251250.1 YitT family protein [Bacteroidales bacterium]MDD6475522.1 YitT family protein [Sodaliphilus pleomorphus]MDD6686695.1 YitT family protein [Sodaliphilus pleomorphus]MDD7066240.1 YitT family protein [Sodaliphilus pleomorphus]